MTAPIEAAMSSAMNHEDAHSVWAALVAMALYEDKEAPLLGITDDGSAVLYRAATGKREQFTFPMLKGRLERQKKIRKGS